MTQFAEVIRGWLGWCPNTHALKMQVPAASTGTGLSAATDRESPWPGILPKSLEVPHWMTVLALVILFATCFVGGNFWWPVLVVIVLIACIALLAYRNYRRV